MDLRVILSVSQSNFLIKNPLIHKIIDWNESNRQADDGFPTLHIRTQSTSAPGNLAGTGTTAAAAEKESSTL
jgi:hypothetical protein